jgi:two-component system, NarL family, sensor histidine kinase UhpB
MSTTRGSLSAIATIGNHYTVLWREGPWREVLMIVCIAALSVAISAHFELSERLYALTRRWEFMELDEIPGGMAVLAIGLIGLCWGRIRQARRELQARLHAETQLKSALAANRKLTQEYVRLQEAERKHLARELHDQLGQYLNAIKLDAISIRDSIGAEPQSVHENAVEIVQTVDHVYATVSDMIRRLRPVGLDELGLVAAVEHCVDQWRRRLPQTRFTLAVRGDFDQLDEPMTLTLYRLIQEALTNVYKHARARNVDIILNRRADELLLSVADDGCGMLETTMGSRFGLSGMRERVEIAGGRFVLQSAPGRGLSFEVLMPTNAQA